jgi:hypothetical protein
MSLKLLGVLACFSFIFATASFAGESCSGDKDKDTSTRTPQSDVQKDSSRKPDSASAQTSSDDKVEMVESVDQLVNRPPNWAKH